MTAILRLLEGENQFQIKSASDAEVSVSFLVSLVVKLFYSAHQYASLVQPVTFTFPLFILDFKFAHLFDFIYLILLMKWCSCLAVICSCMKVSCPHSLNPAACSLLSAHWPPILCFEILLYVPWRLYKICTCWVAIPMVNVPRSSADFYISHSKSSGNSQGTGASYFSDLSPDGKVLHPQTCLFWSDPIMFFALPGASVVLSIETVINVPLLSTTRVPGVLDMRLTILMVFDINFDSCAVAKQADSRLHRWSVKQQVLCTAK